jgi:hypothetical protein
VLWSVVVWPSLICGSPDIAGQTLNTVFRSGNQWFD